MLCQDKEKDFEANLKPLSIDSFNQMVDKSVEDEKKGNVVNALDLKVVVIKKRKLKWKSYAKIISEIKAEPD